MSEQARKFQGAQVAARTAQRSLSPALVSELRAHLAALPTGDDEALAFPSRRGTPLAYSNALRRVLRPAAEEAGAPWAGFHTFRHTFASLHLAAGTNVLQLSRLMGHHSAEFTLRVYAHLIPGDEPEALDLDAELRSGVEGDRRATSRRGLIRADEPAPPGRAPSLEPLYQ